MRARSFHLLLACVALPGRALCQLPESRATPRPISGNVDCPACVLRLDTVARIGGFPARGAPRGPVSSIARRSVGDFLVSFHGGDERSVMLLDSTGRYVRSIAPVDGTKPGTLRFLVDRQDSLFVFDEKLGSMTVYSPELRLVRTAKVGPLYVHKGARLPDGRLLLAADLLTEAGVGSPLHVLSRSGEVNRSFGSPDTAFLGGAVGQARHALGTSPDGSTWTSARKAIRLRQWTPSLQIAQELFFERKAPPSWLGPRLPTPGEALGGSELSDLASDPCGWLWLLSFSQTGAAGLTFPAPLAPGGRGPAMVRIRRPDLGFRTSVDIVDVGAGKVVAAAPTGLTILQLLPNRLALAGRTDESGAWTFVIVRMVLADGPSGGGSASRPATKSTNCRSGV
jgi:hypothetical protein